MNILLIGEYSRLHNSLKEGLIKLGHNVILVGTEDGFKQFPVDYNYGASFFSRSKLKSFSILINRLTSLNLPQIESAIRFYRLLPKLKEFDTVQLINENSIKTNSTLEIWLLKKIIKNNKKIFLLSCGIDHLSVKYAYDKKFKYSILTPYHENQNLKDYYKFILLKLQRPAIKLHDFIFKHINGVLASDIDYHLPLLNHPKYLGLIPNPINYNKIEFIPLSITNKIIIFHGVNSQNYIKKGNVFFDEALEIIKNKFPDKVKVIRTEDIPYNDYIKVYDACHILLDQVYAYDQGYNALEAMAKGKVVFTGAEQEWLDYYNIEADTVAINALPDANKISAKLEWLILNPENILNISSNARAFIEKEHDYITIAQKYLEVWKH
ncbi:glycosyltransferase [Gelidibacter maritimus]|uniref:Glycosyltransferase n=1 Tax=Gelidibacter maritimus TaxID=2761487 RepID=A0A7W2M539_9FLAO|nr:glycosyltransferase [Gelidibacter maritimus]MBA6152777.1 glycosyltransferase [Gelidibacter maritimus]